MRYVRIQYRNWDVEERGLFLEGTGVCEVFRTRLYDFTLLASRYEHFVRISQRTRLILRGHVLFPWFSQELFIFSGVISISDFSTFWSEETVRIPDLQKRTMEFFETLRIPHTQTQVTSESNTFCARYIRTRIINCWDERIDQRQTQSFV